MSERAERLSNLYLNTLALTSRRTRLKKHQVGAKALATFLSAVVDECETMTMKTSKEIYQIIDELENID